LKAKTLMMLIERRQRRLCGVRRGALRGAFLTLLALLAIIHNAAPDNSSGSVLMDNTIEGGDYLPRADFGQFLEPKGNHILHGAGALLYDEWQSVYNYRQLMFDRKPIMIMSWATLGGGSHNVYDQWQALLKHLPREHPIAQIGLNFNVGENPEMNFEHLVARGDYDAELRQLLSDLGRLDIPILLRVGLAFNADFHNYAPSSFKGAFKRTHNIMHEVGATNVALVWDFAPFVKDTDFMKYYPGDEYVDWWGMEVFLIEDTTRQCTKDFLQAAMAHRKPVVLSETTPLGAAQSADSKAWSEWFEPFFRFVRENPVIKAVCYINWDWTQHEKWAGWGDRRLETNAFLAVRYYKELGSPIWIHANQRQQVESCFCLSAGNDDVHETKSR